MTKLPLRSASVALLALAACNNKPTVVGGPPDPMANAIANAPPVELPPPIAATVEYRCKDNSLVTVDWFKGDMMATIHPTKTGAPVRLTADKQGGPFTADGGYKLTGDQKKIEWTDAGKKEQACNV